MTVARTECCRVAVDRSSARNVRNKALRRFGPDRRIDFERYELNVWVGRVRPTPRCELLVSRYGAAGGGVKMGQNYEF